LARPVTDSSLQQYEANWLARDIIRQFLKEFIQTLRCPSTCGTQAAIRKTFYKKAGKEVHESAVGFLNITTGRVNKWEEVA